MNKVTKISWIKIRSSTTIPLCLGVSLGQVPLDAARSSVLGLSITFILLNTLSIIYEVDMYSRQEYAPFILGIIFQIITNIFMALTTVVDPGVIPQQIRRYQLDQELFQVPMADEPAPPARSYGVTRGNLFPEIKYCEECRIFRPVRTIHCGICNHCVQVFDHHCAWIGVCIGRRNYRYFLMFCITTMVHITICIIFTALVFAKSLPEGFGKALQNCIVSLIIFIVGLFFLVSLSILVVYHFTLIRRGLTTNQHIKELYESTCRVPFEKGILSFREATPTKKKEKYFFKGWSQMLSIHNNSDMSTERSRALPLLSTN